MISRCFILGVEVAEEVSDETQSLAGESTPARIAFAECSSAFCKSTYTRKLREDHPSVRTIPERVETEREIALASPCVSNGGVAFGFRNTAAG